MTTFKALGEPPSYLKYRRRPRDAKADRALEVLPQLHHRRRPRGSRLGHLQSRLSLFVTFGPIDALNLVHFLFGAALNHNN